MRKANRVTLFRAPIKRKYLKKELEVNADITGIRLHPGKWTPTAIASVGLTNKSRS